MTERERFMEELLYVENSRDEKLKIDTFERLNNSWSRVTQTLYDNKVSISYHLHELESKYIRFGFANQSIIRLLRGNTFAIIDQQKTIIDIFSVHSIVRRQIESFLWMFYLFYDDIDIVEKEFRYDIYKLHGLLKQSRFDIKNDKDKNEILKKRSEILSEIEQIKLRIIATQKYLDASEIQKRGYLEPPFPKLIKSEILYENSRLAKARIQDLWSLYSNHAHAEHISDRQASSIVNNGFVDINTFSSVLSACSILTARLIKNLINQFPCVEKLYNNMNEKEKVPIDIWSGLSN